MAFIIVARLNAKIQPIDRGDVFEDPLNEALEKAGYGEVAGGGTQLGPTREIAFCELEIALEAEPSDDVLRFIINELEGIGTPKGSRLLVKKGHEIPFGNAGRTGAVPERHGSAPGNLCNL